MKNKTKYFVWLLGFISFLYVASGGALAFHLISHNHDHNNHNEHDSSTCDTCQSLVVFSKKALVEAPLLIPELSPAEFDFFDFVSCFVDHNIPLAVHPRAPPV